MMVAYSGIMRPIIGVGLTLSVVALGAALASDDADKRPIEPVMEQASLPLAEIRGTLSARDKPVIVADTSAMWRPAPDRAVRLVYAGHLGHGWVETP